MDGSRTKVRKGAREKAYLLISKLVCDAAGVAASAAATWNGCHKSAWDRNARLLCFGVPYTPLFVGNCVNMR